MLCKTAVLKRICDRQKMQTAEIKYGIKLCNKNIGFNGKFYTFPYFCAFLLKRYMFDKIENKL